MPGPPRIYSFVIAWRACKPDESKQNIWDGENITVHQRKREVGHAGDAPARIIQGGMENIASR